MIIECQGLFKQYTVDRKVFKAVDNANLQVNAGEFVVILGHSGSGKTTFLSLVGGLTKPDSGKVLINGRENWQQADSELAGLRNRTIGFIFQFASLIPTLTALENVLLPLSFGGKTAGGRERGIELLRLVGLGDKNLSFPAELSGGQQRRVAIARAFINEPEIILADEPTGDLDEETEHEILGIFRAFNQKGTTFLVVTHNRDLANVFDSPRILRMKAGVLTEEGHGH